MFGFRCVARNPDTPIGYWQEQIPRARTLPEIGEI